MAVVTVNSNYARLFSDWITIEVRVGSSVVSERSISVGPKDVTGLKSFWDTKSFWAAKKAGH